AIGIVVDRGDRCVGVDRPEHRLAWPWWRPTSWLAWVWKIGWPTTQPVRRGRTVHGVGDESISLRTVHEEFDRASRLSDRVGRIDRPVGDDKAGRHYL